MGRSQGFRMQHRGPPHPECLGLRHGRLRWEAQGWPGGHSRGSIGEGEGGREGRGGEGEG